MSSNVDLSKLNTPKIVECNECGHVIKKIVAKTERLTENRIGYFFCCDRCGFKYPFAAITEKGLDILKKMNKIKMDRKKFPAMAKSFNFMLEQKLKEYKKEFTEKYFEEDILNGK